METISDDSEASGSDVSETKDDIRTKLDGFFWPSVPKGLVMCSFHSSPSPNPVIEITSAGIVRLPLSSRGADAVRKASHAAPFVYQSCF